MHDVTQARGQQGASRQRRSRPVIAIDGPAGAGKSTLAAHLARRFGFLNLETGAMYRALALKAIESDLSFDEEEPLLALAEATRIDLQPQLEGNRVLLDGMDVSRRIRERGCNRRRPRAFPCTRSLRAWMVGQQRALGAEGGVVMEGRDIGTAVFPGRRGQDLPGCRARGPRQSAVSPGDSHGENHCASDPVAPGACAGKLRSNSGLPGRPFWTRCANAIAATATGPSRRCARPSDAVILDSTAMTLEEVLARRRSGLCWPICRRTERPNCALGVV